MLSYLCETLVFRKVNKYQTKEIPKQNKKQKKTKMLVYFIFGGEALSYFILFYLKYGWVSHSVR